MIVDVKLLLGLSGADSVDFDKAILPGEMWIAFSWWDSDAERYEWATTCTDRESAEDAAREARRRHAAR